MKLLILFVTLFLHEALAQHDHSWHIDKDEIIKIASSVSTNNFEQFESNKIYLESSLLKLEKHLEKTKSEAVLGLESEAEAQWREKHMKNYNEKAEKLIVFSIACGYIHA